jgi:hypothetical protein
MLRRLYSHVAETMQLCCGGYTAMLRRLYSHVAEAIHPCCGGYTAVLRRLFSHVAEAIHVLLTKIIPPQQKCFELFWVVGWVVANRKLVSNYLNRFCLILIGHRYQWPIHGYKYWSTLPPRPNWTNPDTPKLTTTDSNSLRPT